MKKRHILCLIAVFVLVLSMLKSAVLYGANPTVLKVVPQAIVVREGENFAVSIDVCDVVDMQSFQLKVSWDTNFLDYVSHTLSSLWPPPVIILDPTINRTGGYMVVGAFSETATFTGNGTLVTINFHALKSEITSITISDPVIIPEPVSLLTEGAVITILPSKTWVSVAGEISSYGSNSAHGWISIFAVLENWADGWCLFTVPPIGRFRILIYPPPPFNYTLYIVRIVNASVVKLNYNASDFWISGFWAISNVTNPRYVIDIARLVKGPMVVSAGEFSVTGNWTYFAINIRGVELIQGNVIYHRVREIDDIWGRYPYCDLNHDFKIDGKDIAVFAKSYGSMLGFDRYEYCADVNFDLKIDGKDIARCAQCFGKRY